MLQFAEDPDDTLDLARFSEHSTASQASLNTLLGILCRRFVLVASCGLLGLAAGTAASAYLPSNFAATAQLVVDPVELNVIQNELTSRLPSSDAGVSIVETQARIMTSGAVLKRVRDDLELANDPEFSKRPFWRDGGTLEKALLFLGAATADGDKDPARVALDHLHRSVYVSRPERTYMIDITAKSDDPEKAARIANAVAHAYLAERAVARSEMARRTAEELAGRLNGLRTAVRTAEDKVVEFRDKNNLVSANGTLLADQEITELTAQLSAASQKVMVSRARLARSLTGGRGDRDLPLPEIMQSPDLQALRQQLSQVSRVEADLAARLGPEHPEMVQTRAQLDAINRSIQAATDRVVAANRDEYQRDLATEEALSRRLAASKVTATQNEHALVKLHELQRDADARRSVYEAFLQRSREMIEQEKLDTSSARVVTVAAAARKRSFPPSPFILLPGALLFGLLLGAGTALIMGDPRRRHGATALAWVPRPPPTSAS